MADQHAPDWVGPALGAVSTFGVGILAWLGVRFNAKNNRAVDPQKEINEGFSALLDRVERELEAASLERNELRATLAAREEAWRVEREAMRGEIAQLRAVAEGFERLLRRHGITIPERKAYAGQGDPVHRPALIVDATLRQDGVDDED